MSLPTRARRRPHRPQRVTRCQGIGRIAIRAEAIGGRRSPAKAARDRGPVAEPMTASAPPPRLDAIMPALPAQALVSIVIPCLNEERYITALLDALAAQDYGPLDIEVLVADGGSTDATRALLGGYISPFRRLELVDNPKRITASGLNAGMDAARGDCWIIIGAHSLVRATSCGPPWRRCSVRAPPASAVRSRRSGRATWAGRSPRRCPRRSGWGTRNFAMPRPRPRSTRCPSAATTGAVWDILGRLRRDRRWRR